MPKNINKLFIKYISISLYNIKKNVQFIILMHSFSFSPVACSRKSPHWYFCIKCSAQCTEYRVIGVWVVNWKQCQWPLKMSLSFIPPPPCFFAPLSQPFLKEGGLGLKIIRINTFPDPVGNFGAPWRPFWILQALHWR